MSGYVDCLSLLPAAAEGRRLLVTQGHQFDPAHLDLVAGRQAGLLDTGAVDIGAVGALEVTQLQGAVAEGQELAVNPGHQGCV